DLELSSANDSGGVVTAFYLKSEDSELDFEFLGNRKEKPIRVQTNLFCDEYPIRVFKNNRCDEVGFPTQPMQLMATIWDEDSWATNGGKTKIIWAHAPFISHFRGFAIDGYPYDSSHRKSFDDKCSLKLLNSQYNIMLNHFLLLLILNLLSDLIHFSGRLFGPVFLVLHTRNIVELSCTMYKNMHTKICFICIFFSFIA
ncbi:hypothetical protein HYC85_028026, partial [Camellia sinensis]